MSVPTSGNHSPIVSLKNTPHGRLSAHSPHGETEACITFKEQHWDLTQILLTPEFIIIPKPEEVKSGLSLDRNRDENSPGGVVRESSDPKRNLHDL
jgi:hypothetical protein